MKTMTILLALILILPFTGGAQNRTLWNTIIGSAYSDNHSYAFLRDLCDQAGGRVLGSANNEKGLTILEHQLGALGITGTREKFSVPCWTRGEDEVLLTSPLSRRLRAVALGYVDATPAFEAPVVFAGYGFDSAYNTLDVSGKIALVTQERPATGQPLLRYEAIGFAAKHGAKGILFINDHAGTTTLMGMSNFLGKPSPIPAYSLTYEEGKWIQRLLQSGKEATVRLTTRSACRTAETANIVATFPGDVASKIVIGAHFDSWDVGQGAIDNGQGTAILFDVARLLHQFSPHNHFTVECVWFNGEEMGLWGSRRYMERHMGDSIAAMINMDMTGTPTGFNAGGFDDFIPFFRNLEASLTGYDFKDSVASAPGTNSDNQSFCLAGIPAFSVNGHLDEDQYKFYHELGDTFDKVNKKYLSDAAAVVSVLASELANAPALPFRRLDAAATAAMLRKFKLDERLKRTGEWPFGEK
jgi:Iap family predicted aminopeptidase